MSSAISGGHWIVSPASRLSRTRFSTAASRAGMVARARRRTTAARCKRSKAVRDAGILPAEDAIDAGVLDDREEIGDEAAIVEEVEEALHVREGRITVAGRSAREAEIVEEGGRAGEAEVEGVKFQPPRLVCREDFVDGEVQRFVVVLLDDRGQVDGRAFRRGAALTDPADSTLGKGVEREDGHVGAGERATVEPDQLGDVLELNAGGERLDDLFAFGGLQAKEGLPARCALLQDGQALRMPAGEIVVADARKDDGRRFDELHRGEAGVGKQFLGESDNAAVHGVIDFRQRRGRIEEIGMALPSHHQRDAAGERKEARALLGLDALDGVGAALKVVARVGPGRVGDDRTEFEDGSPIGAVEFAKDGGGHAQASAGQLVGVTGEGVDQFDEEGASGRGAAARGWRG